MTVTNHPATRSRHTVHIIDDDQAIRRALQLLLKAEGIECREYASATDFLDRFRPNGQDCALVDVRMPGMSGLELQQELNRRGISLPIVIMTGHGDIQMAVNAMKAGAHDFIEKPFKNQLLLDRLHDCLAQAERQFEQQRLRDEAHARLALLTDREREVMSYLVAGKLNKQIAGELDISTRTVEAHRAKIMEKLQARSLSDIVRLALLDND